MRKSMVVGSVALTLVAIGGSFILRNPVSIAGAARAPELLIYSGRNLAGRSLSVTGTLLDMPKGADAEGNEYSWNDHVRSIKIVSGTWRLYQNGRCNTLLDDSASDSVDVSRKTLEPGWSCLVSANSQGPVEIPGVEFGGFAEDVSSIELVSAENLPDWAVKQGGAK